MNWTGKDMDTYIQQKEYIDTLVIPLVKIDAKVDNMKASASAAEFLMNLTDMIETQFRGRMVFAPPIGYTGKTDLKQMAETTLSEFAETPFKHIFYMTTDAAWTSIPLNGQAVWLPSIPLENMEPSLKQSILEDQLRQLLPKFTEKWSEQ